MSAGDATATLGLADHDLLGVDALIGGRAVDTGSRFPVDDPATGAVIAEVARCGEAETTAAIDAATEAQPAWAAATARERAAVLRRWAELMAEHQRDLGTILGAENGKPRAEAEGEVAYAASFLEWFAEEARRVEGAVLPSPWSGTRLVALRQPIGVAAAITPWNFPAAMLARKVAPALAVGCAMVAKPAEQTPLSMLAMAELGRRAGVPDGVLNVVTGDRSDAATIGGVLTGDGRVRALSFTGSTAVGKLLAAQAAATVTKVSLELGGNAPVLVFDDADLDVAVAGSMAAKFRNAGQTCVAANRIYVQRGIHDAFVARLSAAVADLAVGRFDEPVQVGPLIDEAGLAKVEHLVDDARARGASVPVGGHRHERGGRFFEPSVVTGVAPDMAIGHEEIFGPVAAVGAFDTEAEAVAVANDTPFGLSAYLFTRDLGRAWRVGEALEYGMVGVNTGVISAPEVPFGGWKESGLGREGSRVGVDEYLEMKLLALGDLDER
ncbi:MAG: NAD-dependent succinate-semialdehyde dehydrogenase [Acidimicrobiales bacterium]|nr:NAD-dependent succinate-semialdehyde dehydrogenase [Acidimicrobiales bacterium]